MIAKCRRTFYEHSNKCGKPLPWALRAQQAHMFIPELLNETHNKVHDTEDIADLFREYYTSLYNLLRPTSEEEKSTERKTIQDYLRKSGLPHLSEEELTDLEKPISAVALAMAQMQLSKAPGPDGYFLLYHKTLGTS